MAAVIPAQTFKVMQVRVQRSTTHSWYRDIQERFEEFNTFLFPLPRDQGYEFFVVQFLGKEVHFTSLINYQAHKENAPECLNMIHYTELAQTKGIVLMVGEYDKDNLVRNASLIVFCHYLGSCNILHLEDSRVQKYRPPIQRNIQIITTVIKGLESFVLKFKFFRTLLKPGV